VLPLPGIISDEKILKVEEKKIRNSTAKYVGSNNRHKHTIYDSQ